MAKTITLELRPEDAEPMLRQAADDAAKFGGWCDHITRRTVDMPWASAMLGRDDFDKNKQEWQSRFLQAKRIVEAFGVEYEATSEQETLTTYIPDKVLKSHLVKVAGMTWRHIDKSMPDPKNARPRYAKAVHAEACKQAADRVVRRWREILMMARAA